MKLQATKKEMRNSYYRILSIGYCGLQSLLHEQQPFAYSCGVYGWRCDYYDIDGILISTGYAPLSDKNMKGDYEIVKEYEKKALNMNTANLSFEEKKEKKLALIKEMLEGFKE